MSLTSCRRRWRGEETSVFINTRKCEFDGRFDDHVSQSVNTCERCFTSQMIWRVGEYQDISWPYNLFCFRSVFNRPMVTLSYTTLWQTSVEELFAEVFVSEKKKTDSPGWLKCFWHLDRYSDEIDTIYRYLRGITHFDVLLSPSFHPTQLFRRSSAFELRIELTFSCLRRAASGCWHFRTGS